MSSTRAITIHESVGPNGELVQTKLACTDAPGARGASGAVGQERLAIITDEDTMPLPDGALDAVMKRYGKPLAEGSSIRAEETLELGGGRKLVRFRFLRMYDVIARDYLALFDPEAGDHEALCELATSVTAALVHLGRHFRAAC